MSRLTMLCFELLTLVSRHQAFRISTNKTLTFLMNTYMLFHMAPIPGTKKNMVSGKGAPEWNLIPR
jgi:hypothetical protein